MNAPFPLPPCRRQSGFGFFLSLFIVLLAVTTSCTRREPPADLRIVNGAEPESLDPHIITGQPDSRVVLSMFEGLTRFDPETSEARPGLAESWDISPDGTTYTFHLRSNAVWSTGEPITADDFVYSWIRALLPQTASDYAGQLFYVKNAEAFNNGSLTDSNLVGVKALDDRTLQVELENPTAFFLDLCAFQTLAVVPRQTIEKYGDRWIKARPLPVSGAYELQSWRLNDKIRLRKNPRYWDAANVHCEIVDFIPSELPYAALNLFLTGGADIIWDKSLVPTELLDVLKQRPDCHVFDYLGSYFIRCNVTRKPLDDVRVRKALALAIDKRRIVEKITRAGEKPASALTPRGMSHYQPPEGLGYNPAEARRLLAAAGYPEGKNFPKFEYLMNTSRANEQVAVELQEMWKRELGIEVTLRQAEWKVYLSDMSKTNYDICRSSWVGDYQDPNTFLDMFKSNNGNNRTGWASPRYDELVNRANEQTDPKLREKLLREAETLLVVEDVPIIPLYYYVGICFFDTNRVEGIGFNLLDNHPVGAIRVKR